MSRLPHSPFRLLITDGVAISSNFSTQRPILLETVRLAVSAGVEIVQVREKLLPARLLFGLVAEAVSLTHGSQTKILVNERFDIAIAAGADGVHLTSTSMPVDKVRASLPEQFLLGVSAHSQDELERSRSNMVDYAMLGPVFPTPGKPGSLGISEFSRLCQVVSPMPVVAVGGIDASNALTVLNSGAAGVASIRYLNDFVRIEK